MAIEAFVAWCVAFSSGAGVGDFRRLGREGV